MGMSAFRHLAIPRKGASTHEKVVLRWEVTSPFVVEVLGASGAALQFGTTDRRFHFLNLHKYGRKGQLLCHIWADAEWLEHSSLTDQEVVAEVVGALRAAFPRDSSDPSRPGPLVSEPNQSKVTRWASDPLTLGAYSECQHPDASENSREVYARTEDRVLFAGEGAIPGALGAQCTHGALLSGVSAAVEVLASRFTDADIFPARNLLDANG